MENINRNGLLEHVLNAETVEASRGSTLKPFKGEL